MTQIQSQ